LTRHIYITSDEEIKEGDWCLSTDKNFLIKLINLPAFSCDKKIILTTDQDLIADGVQQISDEFLEWFVKNPSCKFIEVEKTFVTNSGLGYQEYAILDSDFKVLEVVANIPQSSYKIGEVTKLDGYEYITEYKIIIPQEEPKEEYVRCNCANSLEYSNCGKKCERILADQETLEEAAEKWVFETNGHKWSNNDDTTGDNYGSFIEGGNFMRERMYSEDEVKRIAFDFYYDMSHKMNVPENLISENATNVDEWFRQFKKR
jgi:hypothetical protein